MALLYANKTKYKQVSARKLEPCLNKHRTHTRKLLEFGNKVISIN